MNRRQGKIIKAESVDEIMGIQKKIKRKGMRKRITIESEPIPILNPNESLIKFIKEKKQVSYHTLQEHYPEVPETSLRSRIYSLTRMGTLKREKCLCNQGWIYYLNKK